MIKKEHNKQEPLFLSQLEVKNYAGIIFAVLELPDGESVVVGGANAAGKSSLLNALTALLGGAGYTQDRPIHDGATKAVIGAVLKNKSGDEITLTKTIEYGKAPAVKVKLSDGMTMEKGGVQSWLNSLTGDKSFDSEAFDRANKADRDKMVREAFGVDLSEFDQRHEKLYEQRREANSKAAMLKAQLRGLPNPIDAPGEEVSVTCLLAGLRDAENHNAKCDTLETQRASIRQTIACHHEEISRLRAEIATSEHVIQVNEREKEKVEETIAKTKRIDLVKYNDAIGSAESNNEKFRQAQAYKAMALQVADAATTAEAFDSDLKANKDARKEELAKANIPLAEYDIGEAGFTIEGQPYDIASDSEQRIASIAIAICKIPKNGLRLLVVRNAGGLDNKSLEKIKQLGRDMNVALLIEMPRVDKEEVDFLVVDGRLEK